MHRSQKKNKLKTLIKSHAMSADQKVLIEYLKMCFEDSLTKWLAGVDADPERLRGEMACMKELIQILSNSKFELFEGDE